MDLTVRMDSSTPSQILGDMTFRSDGFRRWLALLEAVTLREGLRQRFDVDWFKNPRAWSDLRAQGSLPAREPEGESATGLTRVDALARAFEQALG